MKTYIIIAIIAISIPSAFAITETFGNMIAENLFIKGSIYVDTLCQKDGTCYKLADLAIHKSPTQGFGCPFGFDTYVGGTQGICQSKTLSTSQIPLFLPPEEPDVSILLDYLRDWELEKYATLKTELTQYQSRIKDVCPDDLSGHLGSACSNLIKHDIPARENQINALLDTAQERYDIGWKPE